MKKLILKNLWGWLKYIVGVVTIASLSPLLVWGLVKWWKLYDLFFSKTFPNEEWPNGDGIHGALATGTMILCVLLVLVADEEAKKLTTHTCNICGERLEVGKGEHNLKPDGNCYCICEKCLPTVKEVIK